MSDKTCKAAEKEQSQSAAARKNGGARPQEPALRCPRCDSPNTKFCYYNNYSLSQPRHFCKTCRRYWTKGGALRNVPIGGGCQKSKKVKGSPKLLGNPKEYSDSGGFRFFQGFSPAMDFQMSFPRLHSPSPNQFSSLPNIPNPGGGGAVSTNPCFSLDPNYAGASSSLMGLSFPFSSAFKPVESAGYQEMGSYRSFASPVESLTSMNQEIHWKLQQQRLAMLVSGDNDKEISNFALPSVEPASNIQKLQPILFQNLEISNTKQVASSRKDPGGGNLSTEWFFDNPYAPVAPTPAANSENASEATNWSAIEGSYGLISGI